jgi:hypothetical protein
MSILFHIHIKPSFSVLVRGAMMRFRPLMVACVMPLVVMMVVMIVVMMVVVVVVSVVRPLFAFLGLSMRRAVVMSIQVDCCISVSI